MKLQLTPQSRIYVACPAHVATGGPEVLHQLVHTLRQLGHDASMLYLPTDHPDPVHPQFAEYQNPYVREVADQACNVVLTPESMPDVLERYRKVQKVLWWLSVDLHYDAGFKKTLPGRVISRLNKLRRNLVDIETPRARYAATCPLPAAYAGYAHLVQSEYARRHLQGKKLESIEHLSCYLNDEFLYRARTGAKLDLVLYNPNKGHKFTKKLIAASSGVEWVPIKNMTRVQVAHLLDSAKVYVDFGCHPGKDRIPREAAISGACVITGRDGSASYQEDVPIPEEYKFHKRPDAVPAVLAKIKECLADFERHSRRFDPYRERILSEKGRFREDVERIFGKKSGA